MLHISIRMSKFVQYIRMLCPGRFILVESVASFESTDSLSRDFIQDMTKYNDDVLYFRSFFDIENSAIYLSLSRLIQ